MKKLVIGILAHVDSGKTTLSEAMLYCSGNIRRLGRVDHGDSFLDTFSLERERGITIFSKQAMLKYGDDEITLLDTPGHVDFSAETERTLQVLDYAVLVVSGTDGIQSHTLTLWKLLQRYRVPCFIFVNKMDLPGADRSQLMLQLRARLSEGCVDFTKRDTADFYESIAECGDELLNYYYQHDTVMHDDIADAVCHRQVFPCLFGSALRINGVEELLEVISSYTKMPAYGSSFAGKVFKLSEDKQGRRLTFLKVTGGTLRVRDVLQSEKNVNNEKVIQIRIYSGDKFTTVEEASAGTVCAVTGISFTASGDGLGEAESSGLPVLAPVLTYSMELPENISAHTALEKLKILEAEDPQLNVVWNERYGKIQLRVMGEIQLEVLRSVIADRFGFEVTFGTGSIIYKETITNTVEGVGHFEPLRHYAEVHLVLRPAPRNSGIIFRTECREDQLDRNWQRLILSNLYEKDHVGVLTGSPVTDMEIVLVSGRAHPKHTEGGDFRQAAFRAVRQGLRQAKSILLEPVYSFTLEIPSENVGRAITDIQRMSGSFEQPETSADNITVIKGRAPVSEISSYNSEVIQYTHGKGRLICEFSGYEECHDTQEIIERFGYDPERDTDNPCDSVFCSHGAGFIVKWNEVPQYMHLGSVLSPPKPAASAETLRSRINSSRSGSDIFALDKELMQIFEQTYGPVRRRQVSQSREITAPPKQTGAKHCAVNDKYSDQKEYLLVDGYNVIFSWDELKKLSETNIDASRNMLINILCNYQGYKKCELILVFDAYKVSGGRESVERAGNISIVYTKEAETADMYIEKVTHTLAKDHRVRVVTSDRLEQLIILGNGALRISSRSFQQEVKEAEEEIRSRATA